MDLHSPLVPKKRLPFKQEYSWCCTTAFNWALLLLGALFLLEGVLCLEAGDGWMNRGGGKDSPPTSDVITAGGQEYTLADLQLRMGVCLCTVGALTLLLVGMSLGRCGDDWSQPCAPYARGCYAVLATLLALTEIVLAVVALVAQDSDAGRGEGSDRYMNEVLRGMFIQLALASCLQLGALSHSAACSRGAPRDDKKRSGSSDEPESGESDGDPAHNAAVARARQEHERITMDTFSAYLSEHPDAGLDACILHLERAPDGATLEEWAATKTRSAEGYRTRFGPYYRRVVEEASA